MRKIFLLLPILLLAGCAEESPHLVRDRFAGAHFASASEIAAAQTALSGLQFPLGRAEMLSRLHLPAQGMASLRSTVPRDGTQVERIYLTNPDLPGVHYTLVLDYDFSARTPSGGTSEAVTQIRSARIESGSAPAEASR